MIQPMTMLYLNTYKWRIMVFAKDENL